MVLDWNGSIRLYDEQFSLLMNSATTSTFPSRSGDKSGAAQTAGDWPARLRRVRLPAIIFGSLASVLLAAVYLQFTFVSGIEFNTLSWNLRRFSFRRDPFTNIQLSGITYAAPEYVEPWTANPKLLEAELDPNITQHLKSRLAPSPLKNSSDWDLVSFDSRNTPADAKLLVTLLTAHDAKYQHFWPTWSTYNPAEAKVLWPAIHDLVVFRLYAKVPKILELALSQSHDKKFHRRISEAVGAALREHELRLRSSGLSGMADTVRSVAAGYTLDTSPSFPE